MAYAPCLFPAGVIRSHIPVLPCRWHLLRPDNRRQQPGTLVGIAAAWEHPEHQRLEIM
jgi:hypothetical protein